MSKLKIKFWIVSLKSKTSCVDFSMLQNTLWIELKQLTSKCKALFVKPEIKCYDTGFMKKLEVRQLSV